MIVEKNILPLYVALGSEIDRNRLLQLSINSKREELHKSNELIYFQVDNLKLAKKLCQEFIIKFNLGASNWLGGRVVDENFNFIAKISYNGRVWDNDDWKMAKEIDIC